MFEYIKFALIILISVGLAFVLLTTGLFLFAVLALTLPVAFLWQKYRIRRKHEELSGKIIEVDYEIIDENEIRK